MFDNTLKKNVLMVVHSYYLDDTRVRREAEALVSSGYSVDVICLNKGGEPKLETSKSVNIHRCSIGRSKNRGKFNYIKEYIEFFLLSFIKSTALACKKKYAVFFAHNMPNFLVFSGLMVKLRGGLLVLDMHDSMPELYQDMFSLKDGPLLKLLKFEERLSVKLADKCMTANIPIANILSERNRCDFFVVHNTPDLTVLRVCEKIKNKRFKLFHHGNIHQRYGLDRVLPTIKSLNSNGFIYELEVHGRGPWYEQVKSLAKELTVQEYCVFNPGFQPQDIGGYLAGADVGLVLNHQNDLTDLLLPVKMLEYIACKIPVICPRSKAIEAYFDDKSVYYFDNIKELEQLIIDVSSNGTEAKSIADNAYNVYKKIAWQKEKEKFLEFVEKI